MLILAAKTVQIILVRTLAPTQPRASNMSELKRLALTPLLVGVHAGWTIADSVKRIRLRAPSSCGRLSSSGKTPRHVAVALVLPPSIDFHVDGRCGSPSLGKGKRRALHVELEDEVEKEVLGCVDELVRWAAELGASELSLWNEHGKRRMALQVLAGLSGV
jgi:hypothetical protein